MIDIKSDNHQNDVDFSMLARDIKLPGGNIKNIALMATFYAAEKNEIIQMKHIVKGVRR